MPPKCFLLEFLASMGNSYNFLPTPGMTPKMCSNMMDHLEKVIMTRLYRDLFCPPLTDDEQKDLAIQNRIRRLRWVAPSMLEAAINEDNSQVQRFIEEAQESKHAVKWSKYFFSLFFSSSFYMSLEGKHHKPFWYSLWLYMTISHFSSCTFMF